MLRALAGAAVFLVFITFGARPASASLCQFFRFPQEAASYFQNRPCLAQAQTMRPEGGIQWKASQPGGRFFFPVNQDIDGDQIANLLDPQPFDPKQAGRPSCAGCLPGHMIATIQPSVASLQRQLHQETGLYTMSYRSTFGAASLEALLELSRAYPKLIRTASSRLSYILESDRQLARQASGRFLEPVDAILISPELNHRPRQEQLSTLAHEIGHALLFAGFAAQDFAAFAKQLAGWRLDSARSLYSPRFLRPYSGEVGDLSMFPNNYSFANAHEWFGENVAQVALKRLGRPHQANERFERALQQKMASLR